MARGEALYIDNCTGCHMANGAGIAKVFPPLKGSRRCRPSEPATVIHASSAARRWSRPRTKPTGLAMPGFGWKLDDQEIADLATYIRNAWGNRAPLVDAGPVADVRKQVRQAEGR